MNLPIVPVYLNQKLVFDLVAMLRGGISTVTAVTTNSSEQDTQQQQMSAGFGLSEAFSTLLRINLSAGKSRVDSAENSSITTEDRVHTPASLFYELRGMFIDNGYVKQISAEQLPESGDFVEFDAWLKRNPIVETLDSFAEMMNLADMFSDEPQRKGKGGKPRQSENQKIREQMLSLSRSLKAGSTIDLTATDLVAGYSSVITVETNFLNDPMMSDLVDGQFKTLGKVIRSVRDESGSISLLRKTALSKMPGVTLSQTFDALTELESQEGFVIPEMTWEVKGPAIQVLPVAIYA